MIPGPRRRGVWKQIPPSADRWCAGDLAECIVSCSWVSQFGDPTSGPALGERQVVRAVTASIFDGRQLLAFARFTPGRFDASCFRKVVPLADAAIAADRAFLDRLTAAPAPQEPA